MRRLRVYLSSTYEDLKDFRTAVEAALRKSGLDVAQMEYYTAEDERPLDLCLRDVSQSEIYIGLFAWRYGYVPPEAHGNPEHKSITELEYRQAERSGLRKLLFFAHKDTLAAWPDRFKDEVTGDNDRGGLLKRFRDEVCTEKTASFFRTADELATLVLAAIMRTGLSGRIYNVPPLPAGFVPRPALAGAVINALTSGSGVPRGVNTLIQGPGGFGKTTLALEASHDAAVVEAYPDGMLWTSLGRAPTLVSILSDLYVLATDSPPIVAGEEQIGLALAKVLKGRRCLVIVDDVWRPDDLVHFLRLDGPRLLVTTRLRTLLEQSGRTDWAEVVVGELTGDESVSILCRGTPIEAPDAILLERLAERLGSWPLLLELVGARLREEQKRRGRSIAESIQVVSALLERKGVFSFDPRGATGHDEAVARSMDAGLDVAEEWSPGLRRKAGELSVFPQNLEIPVAVAAELWHMDAADVEEDVLRPLDDLSLLRWNAESGTLRLHAMVSAALAARIGQEAVDIAALHRRLLDAWGDPHTLPHEYAWRWFGWHCGRAQEADALRTLLLDVAWLEAKLAATSVDALLGEFDYCQTSAETDTLRQTIRLCAHVLARDPSQLPAQLLARVTDGSELRTSLARQAQSIRHAWLRSLRPTLTAAGGPLLRTLAGHTEPITGVAVTPDGRRVVSASEDETLRVWDLESGGTIRILAGFRRRATAVAVSPDGTVVVAGLRDGRLLAWRLEDGVRFHTLDGKGEVEALAITPDGTRIVSASDNRTITIWDLEHGESLRTLDGDEVDIVAAIAVASDSRQAFFGSRDGWLRVRDLESGTLRQSIKAGFPLQLLLRPVSQPISAVALTPDGARAIVATWHKLLVVQLEPVKALHILEGHTSEVTAVAVTSDGTRAVSGSRDCTLRVWDLANGEPLLTLEGHSERIAALAMTPDGTRVISGSADQTIKVWSLTGAAATQNFRGHTAAVTALALTPDGTRAMTASDDYSAKMWDLERTELLRTIDTGPTFEEDILAPGPIIAMAITADGRLVSIGQHLKVRVWNLADGALLTLFDAKSRYPSSSAMAVIGNGANIALASAFTLNVWDLSNGDLVATFEGHTGAITAIAAVPDTAQIVSASEDGTVRLWDLTGTEAPRVFAGHSGIVTAIAITRDGTRIVSAGGDSTLKVWNVHDGSLVCTLKGHPYRVTHAVLTPDGGRVVSAGSEDVPRTWDLQRGAPLGTFSGHKGRVSALTVTADGSCAVLGTEEGTIAVWQLATCTRLTAFDVDASISGLAVTSDGRTLLAGDNTGGVHFLRLENAKF